MNRIDRLFAILLLLQNRRVVRASDIAERFEITERTVYRDIAALAQMGVPVVSLPGVGYRIMEGFYLPPLVFTSEEASALYLGAAVMTASGNFVKAARGAIEKLNAALPERTRRSAQTLAEMVEFTLPKNAFNLEAPYLVQLRDAIVRRRTVHLRYHSRSGDRVTERDVDPYSLTTSQAAWYFSGFCHLRQDIRSFRLDRVDSLIVLRQTFSVRKDVLPAAPAEQHQVRLRVAPDQARWLRERQHYGFVGETAAPAGIEMIYRVETFAEIQPWILGWGASVEVLEPPALRDAVFAEAGAVLERRQRHETS
jgi:predicted DNA-binding transcriptional regulator YafY